MNAEWLRIDVDSAIKWTFGPAMSTSLKVISFRKSAIC